MLLSIAVLGTLCAVALPFPLGILGQNGQSQKDSSERFPCQNRPCGCRSADQCWKKCCCFTNTQKVAWAKANCVAIPDYVIVAANSEKCSQDEKQPNSKTCCSSKRRSSAKSKMATCSDPPVSLAECCSGKVADAPTSDDPRNEVVIESAKSTPNVNPWKWVLAFKVAECEGVSTCWFCLPATVLPEPPQVLSAEDSQPDFCIAPSERLHSSTQKPPLPPPRLA
jgi:hypothetical protein